MRDVRHSAAQKLPTIFPLLFLLSIGFVCARRELLDFDDPSNLWGRVAMIASLAGYASIILGKAIRRRRIAMSAPHPQATLGKSTFNTYGQDTKTPATVAGGRRLDISR